MKSKLRTCFAISSAFFETTTSSAPSRSASSFLFGDVVKTHGVRPESVCELYAHVPEPAEPDDADLLALCHAPVPHRRVGRDARAEQRRGPGEVEVRRDAEDEPLVHDDAVGVAAVGDRGGAVLVRASRR